MKSLLAFETFVLLSKKENKPLPKGGQFQSYTFTAINVTSKVTCCITLENNAQKQLSNNYCNKSVSSGNTTI